MEMNQEQIKKAVDELVEQFKDLQLISTAYIAQREKAQHQRVLRSVKCAIVAQQRVVDVWQFVDKEIELRSDETRTVTERKNAEEILHELKSRL